MQNLLEDYFIPVRGNDTTTRIDTVPGLQYNGIDDVDYLRDKLFAALKIPKAFMGYEKDLTGKATLAAEDIRFARTIERLQRIVVSELTKIALVHLYTQGYTDDSLTNFELELTTPSIIYEQERTALMKEKVDLAAQMVENNLFSTDWIYKNLFHLSEAENDELRDQIVEDKKGSFRLNQITEEGNDPASSGQAFGTPHQIASLYGGAGIHTAATNVPVGYDEKDPLHTPQAPGKPSTQTSIMGTDSDPLGTDRLGMQAYKSKETGGENGSLRSKYQGGSPLALENNVAKVQFLQNKDMFAKLNPTRKVQLFEKSDLLNEDNIKENL